MIITPDDPYVTVVFGPNFPQVASGAVINGLSTVDITETSVPATVDRNILKITSSDLSNDTITNIQKLEISFSGVTSLTQAQFNEFQSIVADSIGITVALTDGGTYSLADSKFNNGFFAVLGWLDPHWQ